MSSILRVVTTWAESRNDIAALALVGSWARGTPTADSDVDLMLLTPGPESFRTSGDWLLEVNWSAIGLSVRSCRDAAYGAVWSRHVELSDGTWVEFSFGHLSWATARPCDPGTLSVLSGGFRVLYDPASLLQHLVKDAAYLLAQPGRLAGGAYAPSARRRLAWFVRHQVG